MNKLIRRLDKIGIVVKLGGNFPWVYLLEVDGNIVKEKHQSEHAFTIGYHTGEGEYKLIKDTELLFDTIRKYRNGTNNR